MHFSIPILVVSLFYILLTSTLFFTKQKVKTLENKIYGYLIIITFIGIITDILGIYAHLNLSDNNFFRWLIVKVYLMYLLTFAYLITTYILSINKKNLNKKVKKFLIITFTLCLLLNFILPFEYYKDGSIVFIKGINALFLYAISGINILFWIFYILFNLKVLNIKKVLPIIIFTIISIPVTLLQLVRPELLLVTSLSCFIVVLMYHTIENPDLKLIRALNLAKDAADKANNAKTDFLSSMSHEIRTPLNAIVGFSECVLDASSLDEAKENASDIITASNTLLEIVNGILDISKIEAGKLEIINSHYNTKDLFENIIKLTKARLGSKEIDFKINIAQDIPNHLYGDYANIQKVILNLLTNAIKYTESGFFELNVNCIKKDDICRLIIAVEDSGRGIKPEDINKLFTKFQRLDEDRNTTLEGTGLGLAITKRLVELMGGNVVVQSVYGQGSKFTVSLDQRIMEVIDTNKVILDNNEIINIKGKKILIVDDNKLNLKLAEKLLSKYDCEIELVESGFDCITNINNGKSYDLILMDDMMPNMSGVETFKKLKEDPNFNIKTVALTANAITGMREKYLSDGFDDYLAKPIIRTELERILKTL